MQHKLPRSPVAAVVLAAGAGTRFGGPKQRLFLPRVLAALAASPVEEVVAVVGAHDVDAPGARVVRAEDWARGPGASLRAGLTALGDDVEAAVVALADGPNLSPAAVSRVLALRGSESVLAATYDGRSRSHPVLIERDLWDAVPDEGARSLPAVLVDCTDIDPPGDVDRAGD